MIPSFLVKWKEPFLGSMIHRAFDTRAERPNMVMFKLLPCPARKPCASTKPTALGCGVDPLHPQAVIPQRA
jgi:hypothetical protein